MRHFNTKTKILENLSFYKEKYLSRFNINKLQCCREFLKDQLSATIKNFTFIRKNYCLITLSRMLTQLSKGPIRRYEFNQIYKHMWAPFVQLTNDKTNDTYAKKQLPNRIYVGT